MRSRLVVAAAALAAAASMAVAPTAHAQKRPANLESLPPVPTDYTPPRTAWGDYDFSHTYQTNNLGEGHILFQRPKEYGNRIWVTDEEYARRLAAAVKSDGSYTADYKGATPPGTQGLADWVRRSDFAKRTSLLVDPPNGQLPPLTPQGQHLFETGRSGWVPGQSYDWVTDFDTWDRCITRGFPASMLPFRYNNGIQIFQAPGYVVISLEMIHDARVIPTDGRPAPPSEVTNWMGASRGRWEGNTLVIETSNIRPGAAPLNMATIGAPPNNTIPMSPQAHVTERLTMTGPNAIVYEMTFSDPVYWTAPFTVRLDWQRNQKYGMFEYACHEGDEQVRNYITASHAQRAKDAAAKQAGQPPPLAQAAPAGAKSQ